MTIHSYIVLDLEATCWEKGTRLEQMETIEFGAVRLEGDSLAQNGEFSRFVRPTQRPLLSDFCKRLTGIAQEDVDHAATFPEVFQLFLEWIGEGNFKICTWGAYDVAQLKVDCRRHGLPFPQRLEKYINLKKMFSSWRGIKPCGMKRALAILGLPLEGQHHRAIDDARNIAKIAQRLLREQCALDEGDA